jgi:uridine kinase
MTSPVDPRWVERVAFSEPGVGEVRLVCIDGPAGSGKTTLAAALAEALAATFGDVPVVHGDELYEGWDVVAGSPDRVSAFDALSNRVESWLLERWRHGWPGSHPRWDWYADAWGEPVEVPLSPVVILEGVGLAARALRAQAALTVWVEAADDDARLGRVLARDGESLRAEMIGWLLDEAEWHRRDGTRAGADAVLRT